MIHFSNTYKIILSLTLVCISISSFANDSFRFGANVGLVVNMGSSINRIGISVTAHNIYSHFQTNARIAFQYNLKHWGDNISTPELQCGVGILWAFGNIDSLNFTHDLVSNQTNYSNSIGYAFNYYADQNETSQRSGIIGLQFKKIRIITENDLLGEFGVDKYRTAAAMISYIHNDIDYGLKMILWTGNCKSKGTLKIKNDSIFKARYGYFDVTNSTKGLQSHGILCIQAQKTLEYSQLAKAMIGIDAEQVRNIFQNKIMHDAFFLPEWLMGHKNLHYPMISDENSIYKYRENQKIRKAKPFINISSNDNIFY